MKRVRKMARKNKNKKEIKVEWCDRTVYPLPFHTLVTTQAQMNAILKKIKHPAAGDHPFVNYGSDATTHIFQNLEGETMCVVGIKYKGVATEQVMALLSHEATHVYQEYMKLMNEDRASSEFEAYSIQKIFQNLLYEYVRHTGTRSFKNGKKDAVRKTR